jgi:hypothetical protein
MSNNGSGYTSNPTVVWGNGSGTAPTGTSALSANGKIYGVYIGTGGSGLPATFPVTFSGGGGGSGATGTALVGSDASLDRVVTFRFASTAVVQSAGAGNIYLTAGDFTGAVIKTLTLRSVFGSWIEVSRAG